MAHTRIILITLALLATTACSQIELDQQPDNGEGGGGGSAAVDDGGPVGSMGPALLGQAHPSITIEVDTAGDRSLTDEARGALEDRLRRHGNKDQIDFAGSSSAPSQDVYSDDDLRRIADRERSTSSSADGLSLYVLLLDGRYENEDAVGVAFGASAFAIFPERIEGSLVASLSYASYEEAIAVHELGHLFGLVDLTGQGGFHEDPDNPGHSENEDSVMFWRVEDVSITSFFEGGPPSEFDADDRKEMDRIRG